jgi:hypothetical protein
MDKFAYFKNNAKGRSILSTLKMKKNTTTSITTEYFSHIRAYLDILFFLINKVFLYLKKKQTNGKKLQLLLAP